MLCPEVWNFAVPEPSIKYKTGKTKSVSFEADCFFYNHLISVVLPSTSKVPEELLSTFSSDCDYYNVLDVPVSELVKKNFLKNFIEKGSLTALSINTRLDCENCVAVTPTGALALLLNRETYQTVGIEGKVPNNYIKSKSHFIIKIDLQDLCSADKDAKRKQILSKLEVLGKVTLLINWKPKEENVCPSSIAKYFHEIGCKVLLCTPQIINKTKCSVKVPKFHLSADFNEEEVNDFIEWLGMLLIDGNIENESEDDFISTYETPGELMECSQVKCLYFKGFYRGDQVQTFFKRLMNYFETQESPWVSMYVQSFSDSPFGWKYDVCKHSDGGNNSFTFVANDIDYVLATQKSK